MGIPYADIELMQAADFIPVRRVQALALVDRGLSTLGVLRSLPCLMNLRKGHDLQAELANGERV